MKNSIIYLGIALVTFTNVMSALGQQSFIKDNLTSVQSKESVEGNKSGNSPAERKNNNNSVNMDPETIVVPAYQKTMEEIIAENNQIIESPMATGFAEETPIEIAIDEVPMNTETTVEESILQDSMIIESPVLNAIQPITTGKPKKS